MAAVIVDSVPLNPVNKQRSQTVPVTGYEYPQGWAMSRLSHCLEYELRDGGETALRAGRPLLQDNSWCSLLLETESSPEP
jgi:hypothetical protein